MIALVKATGGTVVVAGLIAGAWVVTVGWWLHRAVDGATTWGAP